MIDMALRILLMCILSMILGASIMLVLLKDIIDINKLGVFKNIIFDNTDEEELNN